MILSTTIMIYLILNIKSKAKLTKLPRKLDLNKSCSLKFGSFYKVKSFSTNFAFKCASI